MTDAQRRLSTALATLDAARHHSQPEIATRDATDALVAVVREIVGGANAPERAAEGKPQAGDWLYDTYEPMRDWPRTGSQRQNAAWVTPDIGWHACVNPGGGRSTHEGPEVGPLGQTLADLCLCAHGFLAWERIEWCSDDAREAADAPLAAAHIVRRWNGGCKGGCRESDLHLSHDGAERCTVCGWPLGGTPERWVTPETLPAVLAEAVACWGQEHQSEDDGERLGVLR